MCIMHIRDTLLYCTGSWSLVCITDITSTPVLKHVTDHTDNHEVNRKRAISISQNHNIHHSEGFEFQDSVKVEVTDYIIAARGSGTALSLSDVKISCF